MADLTPSSNDNTYVFDPESAAEMARLISLDRMMTNGMGGLLAEQPDISAFKTILDIACGPGSWVIDLARQLPDVDVAGIDISKTMIEYASARARTQKVDNASFGVMNVTKPMDFSDNTFDLVNARFLVMALPQAAWPIVIQECKRILRPGGILRLTEGDTLGITNSPAYEKATSLSIQSLHRAGYGFSPDGKLFCMTPMLPRLLKNAGFTEIKSKAHCLTFSTDSEVFTDIYRNAQAAFHLGRPILLKMGVTTAEAYDNLYEQMNLEMLSESFCGSWPYLTVWGQKS